MTKVEMAKALIIEIDYGRRPRGRLVTVLQDRFFDLRASKPSASFLAPYRRDVSTLSSCLQREMKQRLQ